MEGRKTGINNKVVSANFGSFGRETICAELMYKQLNDGHCLSISGPNPNEIAWRDFAKLINAKIRG